MLNPLLDLSRPGIFCGFDVYSESSQINVETYNKWFQEEAADNVLKTGAAESITRWKAANPSVAGPNLTMLNLHQIANLTMKEVMNVKRTSSLFPNDEPIENLVDYESTIWIQEEAYQTDEEPKGRQCLVLNGPDLTPMLTGADAATAIIWAVMQPSPGAEDDLDAWYRQEHNQQMSKEPGWIRTLRYKLLSRTKGDEASEIKPTYLAIHEFGDGHQLGTEVVPLDPMTNWTKRCMAACESIDAAIYHKVYYRTPALPN